ncbi:MAG: DNA repair protein RecN [Pseudomonadota bacterium]
MLAALSIRNIVLIEALDLDFRSGLTVLTGETGAGKSIVLDSLSLALGARGDAGLVRAGAEQGHVVSIYDLPEDHPARETARGQGIDVEGDLIIRRVQASDGRSRAFINDQPVSVNLLRSVGADLVEIHGQHDDRALVDMAAHRSILDAFAGHSTLVADCAATWRAWQTLENRRRAAEERVEDAKRDEDYLRHALEELEDLDPQDNEEDELSARRQHLMASEKLASDLEDALSVVSGDGASDMQIAAILRKFDRRRDEAPDLINPVIEGLDAALAALDQARIMIEDAKRAADFDPRDLENVEERLFALRGLARKHGTRPDALPDVLDKVRASLAEIDGGTEELEALTVQAAEAKTVFEASAKALSASRKDAAIRLETAIHEELAPLKLDAARFFAIVEDASSSPSQHGVDTVSFEIQTNPGSKPGPLLKVASGGELSRILLALKVALADRGSAPTLVFDEIDTAVGGAVSDAIGERLARLAENVQVLSVTHAPQVAAKADHHLLIAKSVDASADTTRTKVTPLDENARHEEIARMLSGADITSEARAAAGRLIRAAE